MDENGNFVSLAGDSCTVKTCPNEGGRQNGPIFTMKKDNKYVCVTENSNGHYTYHSLAATCPANTTNESASTVSLFTRISSFTSSDFI